MLKEQLPSLNLHKAAEGWLVQVEIFQIAGKKKWEFFVCICEVLSRAASTAHFLCFQAQHENYQNIRQ